MTRNIRGAGAGAGRPLVPDGRHLPRRPRRCANTRRRRTGLSPRTGTSGGREARLLGPGLLTFTSTPGWRATGGCSSRSWWGSTPICRPRRCSAAPPHRPGDELTIDVELTEVRRTAGRDFITVTTHSPTPAEGSAHVAHHRRGRHRRQPVKAAVQRAMMHDVDIMGIDGNRMRTTKTIRPVARCASPATTSGRRNAQFRRPHGG